MCPACFYFHANKWRCWWWSASIVHPITACSAFKSYAWIRPCWNVCVCVLKLKLKSWNDQSQYPDQYCYDQATTPTMHRCFFIDCLVIWKIHKWRACTMLSLYCVCLRQQWASCEASESIARSIQQRLQRLCMLVLRGWCRSSSSGSGVWEMKDAEKCRHCCYRRQRSQITMFTAHCAMSPMIHDEIWAPTVPSHSPADHSLSGAYDATLWQPRN